MNMTNYLSQFEGDYNEILEHNYLHHFYSAQTFEEVYYGANYIAPWISYDEESDKVIYNKPTAEV